MIFKIVTLQEANGLLPLVQEHFFRIHQLLAKLQRARGPNNMARKTYFLDEKQKSIQVIIKRNRPKTKSYAAEKAEKLIEKEIIKVMKLGAIIKCLAPPHIDFLSMRNNEPIYLCWHGGETEIKHWHYLDDGPPMRQFIAESTFFGPHMVH